MRRIAGLGAVVIALTLGAAAQAEPAAQPAPPRMVVWESFGRET